MLIEYDLRRGTYTLRDFRTGVVLASSLSRGMAIERMECSKQIGVSLLATAKRTAYLALGKRAALQSKASEP